MYDNILTITPKYAKTNNVCFIINRKTKISSGKKEKSTIISIN